MEKGNLVEWKKKEGDFIGNTSLAVIETDKSTMDWEYPEDGYLAKILVQPSEGLTVGQPLAIVVEDKESIASFKDFVLEDAAPAKGGASSPQPSSGQAPQPQSQPAQPRQQTPSTVPKPPNAAERVVASPYAKTLAAQNNVDLGSVQGSGPGNRIIGQDVLNAQSQSQPQAAVGAQYTDIPNTNIRKVIASRLTQSKQQIPHYYLTIDINVGEAQRVRTTLNQQSDGKFKLSLNDFIIKASSLALKKVPQCNSTWTDAYVRRFENVDINVAVNTDNGLLTPLIPNVQSVGLVQINEKLKELSTKGREGKLSPTELSTGTFTISNLGGFGIDQFCAVINPPQACILAVGRSSKRLVPSDNEKGFEVAEVMTVTLSCDHRVVDGAVGAQWLQAFKSYLEDPLKMLL